MRSARRAMLVAVVVCVTLTAAFTAHAQTPAPHVRIVTVGGLLGYVDAHVKEKSVLGGVVGVAEWLEPADASKRGTVHFPFRRGEDLLLVTGNNFPLDATGSEMLPPSTPGAATGTTAHFWNRFVDLRADAVALSIDDFLRGLRDEDMAGRFYDAVNGGVVPWVASNAIVRLRKDGLNKIYGGNIIFRGKFRLEIPDDESVGWISGIRVAGGRCLDVVPTLEIAGTPRTAAPGTVTCADVNGEHFQLTFSTALRPDTEYHLTLKRSGDKAEQFHFRTHPPVTRLEGSQFTPNQLVGLPVRHAVRQLPDKSEVSMLVVSMVDPKTKGQLGKERWKWKTTTGFWPWNKKEAVACPHEADECEIDFLPPVEAMTALSSLAKPADTQPQHLVVLMSGLMDPDNLALVTAVPAIRIIVLDPDSSILGRDIGRYSVVDYGRPETAQIWTRPLWIGQEAALIQAGLTWDLNKENPKEPRWLVRSPSATPLEIKGFRAKPYFLKADVWPRQVEYLLDGHPEIQLGGRAFDAYPPHPGALDEGISQGRLWRSMEETAALLLDVTREQTGADIALLPRNFVDTDIVSSLAAEREPLNWLSRYMLAKALYKVENTVTVNVVGSSLGTTLDALAKAQTPGSARFIAAGLGTGTALASVDASHVRVNGRDVVADHVYKIAMPQSVAEARSLKIAQDSFPWLLDRVDEEMRKSNGAPALETPPLWEQLEEQYARRGRTYVSLSSVRFDYRSATAPSDAKLFKNIPLAGRDVKSLEQRGGSAKVDVGLRDYRRMAYRLTGDLRYSKNRVGDVITYPTDEWTAGGRVDLKKSGGWRFFGGYFRQSNFRDPTAEPVTPTRESSLIDPATGAVVTGTVEGQEVTPRGERSKYHFGRVGVELPAVGSRVTLKGLSMAFDFGKTYRDRAAVRIGAADAVSVRQIFLSGLEGFVNQQFADNPRPFDQPQTLTYVTVDHAQRRLQADATVEGTPGGWTNDLKISVLTQFRMYLDSELRPSLTPDYSLELQGKFEWTVFNRFKLGPFYNYYLVGAKDAPQRFKYVDVGFAVDFPIFVSFHPSGIFH